MYLGIHFQINIVRYKILAKVSVLRPGFVIGNTGNEMVLYGY